MLQFSRKYGLDNFVGEELEKPHLIEKRAALMQTRPFSNNPDALARELRIYLFKFIDSEQLLTALVESPNHSDVNKKAGILLRLGRDEETHDKQLNEDITTLQHTVQGLIYCREKEKWKQTVERWEWDIEEYMRVERDLIRQAYPPETSVRLPGTGAITPPSSRDTSPVSHTIASNALSNHNEGPKDPDHASSGDVDRAETTASDARSLALGPDALRKTTSTSKQREQRVRPVTRSHVTQGTPFYALSSTGGSEVVEARRNRAAATRKQPSKKENVQAGGRLKVDERPMRKTSLQKTKTGRIAKRKPGR